MPLRGFGSPSARKAQGAAVGGGLAAALVTIADWIWGPIPQEVRLAFEVILVALASFLGAYLPGNRAPPVIAHPSDLEA
jgi:hypothetical protein